ncbi:MAG: dihydrolipoyl dehydrogenase family protein [Christensenellales bacterium]|jgi:mycothione reductase
MKYDFVVIGSGSGLMVLEEAVKQGLNCAIVEKGKFGGTCLTKGCIPSKMLVYPADLIREIEVSQRVGVLAGQPKIDWATITRRMWEQIGNHKVIEDELDGIPNVTVYKGLGSFTGPNTMVIRYPDGREEEIYGEKFVIAAGARSFVPDVPGLQEAGYVTSETFFGEKFPYEKPWESLVIVGSGAISTEFAHIFSAFGTKVTMIARSGSILSKEEPEVSSFIAKQLTRYGVDILTNCAIRSVSKEGGRKRLLLEDRVTGEQRTVECEEILIASGVRSNGDALSLDKAGVETDKNGWIVTNGFLETSQKHIWAIGDINGKYQFRHKANHEAQILAKNLFGQEEKREASYEAVPWAIFTHPQMARVGRTEKELKESGVPYRVAINYYSEVVGGISMGYEDDGEDNGFVKMIVGEDRKILGVHIVGPQAAVLVQPFVYLMNAGYQCRKKLQDSGDDKEIEGLRLLCPRVGTYAPINDSMVIHPSLNELTAWVFEDFDNQK